MGRLTGKVAVVIGGASGIGAAAVRRIAQEDANVVVGDLNMAALDLLVSDLRGAGRCVHAQRVDLKEEDSVKEIMSATEDLFGAINCLFLNGADTSTQTQAEDTDVVTIDLKLWDHVLAVNLRGYLLGLRYAIPEMLRCGGGSIVCTSSESSFVQLDGLRPAYGVSKAGVNALVRHVAARFGRGGVRCNAIAPGMIETEAVKRLITPAKRDHYLKSVCTPRLGLPDDIAAEVVHLFCDDSAYINGQTISINGGTLFR